MQMSSGNEDDYRKKLAVLSCELRKSQRLQNTYQVVSDKLFDFVEASIIYFIYNYSLLSIINSNFESWN